MHPIDIDQTLAPDTPAGKDSIVEFSNRASPFGHTLPAGTLIGEFEVKGVIGEGGFGIVYLAYDPSLQRHVALKEYMPAALAARTRGGLAVSVKSEQHRETFEAGLKSFVNEARLLARFSHRSLVKVYRIWEAHGTAYMVMPYYEGPTLERALAERAQPPDEADLRAWLDPLLDALAVMHQANCFHRDIAPDNILLTPTGPLLLDFGAARHVIADMSQALTVVLKPGYAPIEQYGEASAMAQGAWTDLYALASVVYFAITGHPPISSVERLMSDTLKPLRLEADGRYSENFLRAIDTALALRPQDRPQSVAQFRALLDAKPASPVPSPSTLAPTSAPTLPPAEPPTRHTTPRHRLRWVGAAVGLAALGVVLLLWVYDPRPQELPAIVKTPQPITVEQAEAPAPPPAPEPAPAVVPPTPSVTAAPALEKPKVRPVPKPAETKRAPPAPAAPPKTQAIPSRCSDILQKASLEALTDDETAYLRRECK